MSRPTRFAGVALAALLAGCALPLDDAADGVDGDPRPLAPAWVEIGATQFRSDGETDRLALPARDPGAALALRATTSPGVCFQLSSAVDGEGRAVVDGRSPGPYCRDCELRTSAAVTSGVFLLPAGAGRFDPATGLSLRFARLDCQTLTPLTTPDDRPALQLAAQTVETVPDLATLDLRFLIADSSILSGDEPRQQQLVAHLQEELAAAGILPRLVDSLDLAADPVDLRFHAGDPTALAAMIAEAPPRAETTVDIVFGGCLLYDDPIFGPAHPVNGFTPRIPGGAGPADAVFLPGLDCFAESAGPADLPARVQAHFLAHELGHYLGLYHALEDDGLPDQLADTDQDNLMHPHPELATALGFSPLQGRVMRMSPAVRAR